MLDDNAVQAKVVLQLLGRAAAYPRADLSAALGDIATERIAAALDSLADAGVVELMGGGVRATEAVKRLDELALIAI
jgi:ubiquinone biosynthesis protein UbiJ